MLLIYELVFIGGSATLSFLSCVRMIVEGEDGCSEFTNDPNRHNLMETVCPSPDGTEPAHMLPDREIVEILVQSYFTHVWSIPVNTIILTDYLLRHMASWKFWNIMN